MNLLRAQLSRRQFCQGLGLGAIAPIFQGDLARAEARSPDGALQKLLDGNARFVGQRRLYPDQSLARVLAVAQTQQPFAALLSCADSRVSPEILFDTGIGDLFDVRLAGNVVTPESLGSLEYAVVALQTKLIVVLGHERCGAVTAAVAQETLPGEIGSLVAAIAPAILGLHGGDLLEQAVVANIRYQVGLLKTKSPVLAECLRRGALQIVGARYDLDTGRVTILSFPKTP
ncbi:MAG: carbonic anhydrase [Alkalinema sp. RU_4_3]|nr:carbonic anhydrase [Alkalinema sp. RU_4_3]